MKNIRVFYLIFFFQFLEVNFSIYLNRRVSVMCFVNMYDLQLEKMNLCPFAHSENKSAFVSV